MFYYVDCPICKKDISRFAEEDNLEKGPIYCPYCESALQLKYAETFDEEMGDNFGMFWFEKWEEK
jgi:uncharacterized protein YbaR (Trm112 family)